MNIQTFLNNIPVYIINLPDSIDRKNSVMKEFNGYNNVNFVDAVDGRDPNIFSKKHLYLLSYVLT